MSYVSSYHHCVFSTKERRPLITPELRERLWPFLGGIARQNKMKAIEVGGVTETINVTSEAPLLETNAVSSGRVIDNKSLMELPVVYIFTHDSIGVGEDGPTHPAAVPRISGRHLRPGLREQQPRKSHEEAPVLDQRKRLVAHPARRRGVRPLAGCAYYPILNYPRLQT